MLENAALIDRYVRDRKVVSGFLYDGALSIIRSINDAQQLMNIRGNICEIGVHHGKLFIPLYLFARSDENAVAVDIFEKQELNVDHSGRGDLDSFINNLETYTRNIDRVKIIKEDSTRIGADDIKKAAGGEIRLFSVDGGHLPHITEHDLHTASGAICEGGVIMLDDYFHEAWPGVSEGTTRFFFSNKNPRIVPFAIGGNKVFFTTKDYADRYIDYLLKYDIRTAKVLHGNKQLFSHPVIVYVFLTPGERFKAKLSQTFVWKAMTNTRLGRFIKKNT